MSGKTNKKPKKKSALAAAASKRLGQIAGTQPKYTPEQMAHMMLHAEERGDVERISLDDGSWGWLMRDPTGKQQVLKPTDDMLAALARFETEGHPVHDDDDGDG